MYDFFLSKQHLDFFMKNSLSLHRQYKKLSGNILKSSSYKKFRNWKKKE